MRRVQAGLGNDAGKPDKRKLNSAGCVPPEGLPDAQPHLSEHDRAEWDRVAETPYDLGALSTIDRAGPAAYCQAYGRWVEPEDKLTGTPALAKTPSGYLQQSPWLTVANKQLQLMGRYMSESGMTLALRSRVAASGGPGMDLPK